MQKIFDSHLHLWNLEEVSISWVNNHKKLHQNYDYLKAKQEYEDFEFLGAMYVETNSDDKDKEALFALKLKKLYGILLCLADLKYKEELCAFREVMHTSVKGAKRLFEPDFKELLQVLTNSNIVFEACLKNEELDMLRNFLSENPNLKIVLNHMGSPKITHFNEYKKDLEALKNFPNLWIKLSAPDDFSLQSPKEFIFELFSFLKYHFNEDKLLFGSNYPVSNLSPKTWANLITESKVFKNLDFIFYKNAYKIYKGG